MKKTDEPSALIFDIERCASNDGPGIRSVVFFKGCNLHCDWCHNPEGINFAPQLSYNAAKCTYCRACEAICEHNVHLFIDNNHTLNRSLCVACFRCCDVCFSGALQRIGKPMTISELLDILLEDKSYYLASGGGVTLSGGEVACHSDFAAKLIKALKANGIHTAIETNLSLPVQIYDRLISDIDLIMADIKTLSPSKFAKHIGSGFDNITATLSMLEKCRKPIIIRTPIIPGVNDTMEDIEMITAVLRRIPSLMYYELLGYHPLGKDKCTEIGEKWNPFEIPAKEHLLNLTSVAKKNGLPVRVDGKAV